MLILSTELFLSLNTHFPSLCFCLMKFILKINSLLLSILICCVLCVLSIRISAILGNKAPFTMGVVTFLGSNYSNSSGHP